MKFIKIEYIILNKDLIECVTANTVIVKHGDEWYSKNETEIKGCCVFMTGDENYHIFENISSVDACNVYMIQNSKHS